MIRTFESLGDDGKGDKYDGKEENTSVTIILPDVAGPLLLEGQEMTPFFIYVY